MASSSEVCTRALAVQQGQQDALAQEHARGGVGDRDAGAVGTAPGFARDRAQPAHALHDLVEARASRVRAGLAEARDAGQDDPRIDRAQRLVAQAQALLDRGAEVLDHHVAALDELAQHAHAFGGLEVDAQAALVAVQVLLVGAAAWPERGLAVGRVDAHHVGAPVGQQAHRDRSRARDGEVEHAAARERQVGFDGMGHGGLVRWMHHWMAATAPGST
jgi:hypothetical protein